MPRKYIPVDLEAPAYSIRMAAGLTQESIAKAVGVSIPSVSQWEDPRRMPNLRTLVRLAQVCGFELVLTLKKKSS